MLRATDIAHLLVRPRLRVGDHVIDATVGNGHDTVMLADAVGPTGHVYGFDVQAEALTAASRRLGQCPWVTLVHAGHETMRAHLPVEVHGGIAAVMFNLGYLPGGAKAVTTRRENTLIALEQALTVLKPAGLVTLVLYPGHTGGDDEAAAVRTVASTLPGRYGVHHIVRSNAATPAPEMVIIERLR